MKPITTKMEEFDALKDHRSCKTINVQVVADFVTITFYKQESTNCIVSRELIPLHAIEHINLLGPLRADILGVQVNILQNL
jgi:hypothetical protein